MDRRFKILIYILIYLLICGKSCVDDTEEISRQEKEAAAIMDSIRNEFETSYLSEESRYAAEIMAIQKLKDLGDYLGIYSDMTLDTLFREKAGEMVRNFFISEDTRLSFGQMGKKKIRCLRLGELLEQGFGEDLLSAEIFFDSIRVLEPLQKSDADSYAGKLAAYQRIFGYTSADTIITPPEAITVEMTALRKRKVFGRDTLHLWMVTLGNMTKQE